VNSSWAGGVYLTIYLSSKIIQGREWNFVLEICTRVFRTAQ